MQHAPLRHPLSLWAPPRRLTTRPPAALLPPPFTPPQRPAFSFNEYVDGESIMGKDIVLWVTMGAQHVPRSEDVPLITNHGTHMTIKPFNYFDGESWQ